MSWHLDLSPVTPTPLAKPHCVLTSSLENTPGVIVPVLHPLASIFTEE